MRIVEVVFYIHGVSPKKRPEPHTPDYDAMHNGIAKSLGDQSLWPNEYGGAEWGWNHDKGVRTSHKALADAQRIFGGQIDDKVQATEDFTINPARLAIGKLRELMFHGFGDMFYYVSAEGKWAVRYAVAGQLKDHIYHRIGSDNDVGVSLTLLGHSAGGVIAFDFLYYLFNEKKGPWASQANNTLSTWAANQQAIAEQNLNALKNLALSGRLRLRRLITFGTPISMLMFRKDLLVERLAQKKTTSPENYGLTSQLDGKILPQNKPRWINIWEKDDLIAWPVEPIMCSELVEDVAIDMADWDVNVHSLYWESEKCHDEIARRW